MSDTVQLSSSAIRRQMLAEFWFYFRANRGAVIGLCILVAVVAVALHQLLDHHAAQVQRGEPGEVGSRLHEGRPQSADDGHPAVTVTLLLASHVCLTFTT